MSLTALLCGEINLFEAVDGLEVIKPHRLQLSPGVCAHSDPSRWAELTAGIPGAYVGVQGDREWPEHMWQVGSAHGIVLPVFTPSTYVEPLEVRAARREAFDAWDGVIPARVPAPFDPAVAYGRVTEQERGPHPAPEVVGPWVELGVEAGLARRWSRRHGLPWSSVPDPVKGLAELGRSNGWAVEGRYSRGTGIHAGHGRPTSLQHMIALRFGRHPGTAREVRAVYGSPVKKLAWSWSSLWVMGPDLPPCGALSLAEVQGFLREPGAPAEWFREREVARAVQEAAAKARAKAAPKKARQAEGM